MIRYPTMTPAQIRDLRRMMGELQNPPHTQVSVRQAAAEIGASRRAWQYWETGITRPLHIYNTALWELKNDVEKRLKEKQNNE